ncbi:MAG: N-acetylmuramoyl-L-alanine amidase [Pseudomonadota bacterium]|nr:N-acetylmuramoyl-L-alanine amidase [Pseudomonadota bacterium]
MLLFLAVACSSGPDAAALVAPPVAVVAAAVAPPAPPVWPAPGAPLRVLPGARVEGTLLLDAGHGAAGNTGNTNWRCESEGDVMRRMADRVATALAPVVTVRRTRPDATLVPYPDRLRASRSVAFLVSLHSDSRAGTDLHVDPATGCYVNSGAAGFAVLWSDEGAAELVAARGAFARAVARRMAEAGFPPYPGLDYGGLYEGDEVPGVFVDRHEAKQRIMLLRRPIVPSVIIETHQAWDPEESARWEEPATWAAFAGAIGAAMGDVAAVERD